MNSNPFNPYPPQTYSTMIPLLDPQPFSLRISYALTQQPLASSGDPLNRLPQVAFPACFPDCWSHALADAKDISFNSAAKILSQIADIHRDFIASEHHPTPKDFSSYTISIGQLLDEPAVLCISINSRRQAFQQVTVLD